MNVTIYYSPNYVYLSASALLVPPQTTLSMVVTAQAQPLLYPVCGGRCLHGRGTHGRRRTTDAHGLSSGRCGDFHRRNSHIQQQRLHHIRSTDDHPPNPCIRHRGPCPRPCVHSSLSVSAIAILALAGAVAAIVGIAISKARR